MFNFTGCHELDGGAKGIADGKAQIGAYGSLFDFR
jgi:hypothetical protein